MSYMAEPNMQEAADKIVAVLKEHKLMGAVFISSQERSGFIHEMSPPWSCIQSNDNEIRIKSSRADFPDLEAQKKVVADSIGGLMGMIQNNKHVFQTLNGLILAISEKIEIVHVANDARIQSINLDEEEQ